MITGILVVVYLTVGAVVIAKFTEDDKPQNRFENNASLLLLIMWPMLLLGVGLERLVRKLRK